VSRLISRAVWDCRLQFRNGFYYAAIVVALLLVGLLVSVPQPQLLWVLPAALLGNLVTNGFYFMAGIVLLEKAEHSLDAQLVTPLRAWEFLLGRVASLCLLSLVESAAIVALVHEGPVNWAALVLGVVMMTSLLACFGLLLVARYESINQFLFPSMLASTLLTLPLLDLLGIWPSVAWYLHPLQAPLELIGGGFEPRSSAQLAAAVAVGVAWTSVAFAACARGFHRFAAEAHGRT
jgi:fluoroquinolone transport system permease protein